MNLGSGGIKAAGCIHDKICPTPLFPIRHLPGQERKEFLLRHAGTFEGADALHLRWCRHDDDGIDPSFGTGLEQ